MGGWSVVGGGVGEDVARWSGWWKMELPEASGGGALAAQDWSAVEGDGDGICGEGGYAAMIAQFADGDEGAGGEGWKNVGFAGGRGKQRDVKERGVGGGDGAAIRE